MQIKTALSGPSLRYSLIYESTVKVRTVVTSWVFDMILINVTFRTKMVEANFSSTRVVWFGSDTMLTNMLRFTPTLPSREVAKPSQNISIQASPSSFKHKPEHEDIFTAYKAMFVLWYFTTVYWINSFPTCPHITSNVISHLKPFQILVWQSRLHWDALSASYHLWIYRRLDPSQTE